jgi:RimJ/RimL family protein N-acetyltransferase
MNLQPTHLQIDNLILEPLQETDFDGLYAVASDPLLWEQHPNNDRFKIEVFTELFQGAMASKAAFKIIDSLTNQIAGSSRYYDLDLGKSQVAIGYTFIARKYWATDFNRKLKEIMLNYAFLHVNNVLFHVGITNFRSQKAVEKLGARKLGEITKNNKVSFEYSLSKTDWKPIFAS